MFGAIQSTGNPIVDVLLQFGSLGVLALVGMYAGRRMLRQFDLERVDLIRAREKADERAKAAELGRDAAVEGLKEFMEIAHTTTMNTLKESQSALSEAIIRERVLVDRIGNLERRAIERGDDQ